LYKNRNYLKFTKFPIGKIILTFVPSPSIELKDIPSPNFSQSFLHKYKPIPVDLPYFLPLVPVNPLSKTLLTSF
jgi:hypothetical protein